MSGGGHGLVASHPIFNEPFETGAAETELVPTPKNYFQYPEGKGLKEKIKVWRVHADPLKKKDYGLVSDGYGFLDSPDCEFVAGGLNSKGPGSVAIGRQGNFLLWGFCAPPAEMTESARKAYLNAVVYAAKFDGAPIVVRDPAPSRDWAFAYAKYLKDAEARKFVESRFSKELLAEAEGDSDKLLALLAERRQWLRADAVKKTTNVDGKAVESTDYVFVVDEHVRSLGIANDSPQLVDTLLNSIGHGENVKACHETLVRYVGFDLGPDFRHWMSWWTNNKDRAFFSDTAGYRFVVPEKPVHEALQKFAKFSTGEAK